MPKWEMREERNGEAWREHCTALSRGRRLVIRGFRTRHCCTTICTCKSILFCSTSFGTT